jgi:hypothetical protein
MLSRIILFLGRNNNSNGRIVRRRRYAPQMRLMWIVFDEIHPMQNQCEMATGSFRSRVTLKMKKVVITIIPLSTCSPRRPGRGGG